MIPRVIHSFWGAGPKTPLAARCQASWARCCPGWEIREWDLKAVQALDPPEARRFLDAAAACGRWAAASDFARMRVLAEFGGVYLDFDVELVRPLDDLPATGWIASEAKPGGGVWLNPGGGIALPAGSVVAGHLLAAYRAAPFDPQVAMMPLINRLLGEALARAPEVVRLDPDFFSPIGTDGRLVRTERTHGIHRYAMADATAVQRFGRWCAWHGLGPALRALAKLRRRT